MKRSPLTRWCAVAALVVIAGAGQAAALDGPSPSEEPLGAGAPGVRLTPASARPGDEVELRVTGCLGGSGTALSTAFVAEARLAPGPAPGSGGELFAEARVDSGARPGEHPIDVDCTTREGKVTGTLVVSEHEGGEHGKPEPAHPTGPVRAGGGGAAGDGREDGWSGGDVGTAGLTLFSGALAGGALLAVRRLHIRSKC
ncbi:hypothetical protein [Streptomyces radicis]|uniref:Sortase n=1 Tax=Streptomyces radicis TaxID=1750517 RepID=A0A3A9W4S6_9ACTN|nr:hypothetical protein [Streptomyces radicis]RKN07850.1 hypothetical protein D7319_17420 [Streptomyces radicis]RKN20696.1 hypothetical protein D7318_17500 [Streptomyces radicis]